MKKRRTFRREYKLEAVEVVLRITMASDSKAAVVNASKLLQEALRSDPANAGDLKKRGSWCVPTNP